MCDLIVCHSQKKLSLTGLLAKIQLILLGSNASDTYKFDLIDVAIYLYKENEAQLTPEEIIKVVGMRKVGKK